MRNKYKLLLLCLGLMPLLKCTAKTIYCPTTVICPTTDFSDCKVENGPTWDISGAITRFQFVVDPGTYKLIGAFYERETGASCAYQYQPPKIDYIRSVVFARDQTQIQPDNGKGSWEQTAPTDDWQCGNDINTDPVPLISPQECPFKRSNGH